MADWLELLDEFFKSEQNKGKSEGQAEETDVGLSENGGHCRTESPLPLPPLAPKPPSPSPVLTEKHNVTSRKTFPVSRFFSSTPKATSKKLNLDRDIPIRSDGCRVRKARLERPVPVLKRRLTKTRSSNKDSLQQTYLDAGQKNFGHMTCPECGMVYTCGLPDDQLEHFRYHRNLMAGIAFKGWKHERLVAEFPDGRIILVLPSDSKQHLKKVDEIRALVDNELGYAGGCYGDSKKLRTFLYISIRKRVVGCAMVEDITEGYRLLNPQSDQAGQTLALCCSENAEPAKLGVSRIWVMSSHRRKGVATSLLDAARHHSKVVKSQIAFSDPTPEGCAFAGNYVGVLNFLVYRWT